MDAQRLNEKDLSAITIAQTVPAAIRQLSEDQDVQAEDLLDPKTAPAAAYLSNLLKNMPETESKQRLSTLAFHADSYVDTYGDQLSDENGDMPRNLKALLVHLPESRIASLQENDQKSIYEAQVNLLAQRLLESGSDADLEYLKSKAHLLKGASLSVLSLRKTRDDLMIRDAARGAMFELRPDVNDWETEALKKRKKFQQDLNSFFMMIMNAKTGGDKMINISLGMNGGMLSAIALGAIEADRDHQNLRSKYCDLYMDGKDSLDVLSSEPIEYVAEGIERAYSGVHKFVRSVFLNKNILLVSEDPTMRQIMSNSTDYKKASGQ